MTEQLKALLARLDECITQVDPEDVRAELHEISTELSTVLSQV